MNSLHFEKDEPVILRCAHCGRNLDYQRGDKRMNKVDALVEPHLCEKYKASEGTEAEKWNPDYQHGELGG